MLKAIILIITTALTTSFAQANENVSSESTAKTKVLSQYIFTPTNNLSSQVQQTLLAAKRENKLALFVLGAQWCHDSKTLAKNFSTPQMQRVFAEKYQVLFVDVGYLEKGYQLVKQFGLPIYYGTPTVMVINPISEKIINKATMQKWLSTKNVTLPEYVSYFDSFSVEKAQTEPTDKEMLPYLSQINAFEEQQALRLKEAYAVVAPLLKAYMKSDDKKSPEEFANKWQQVQDFRYAIQDDIQTLIKQAKLNIKMGTPTPLAYPSYPQFDWE